MTLIEAIFPDQTTGLSRCRKSGDSGCTFPEASGTAAGALSHFHGCTEAKGLKRFLDMSPRLWSPVSSPYTQVFSSNSPETVLGCADGKTPWGQRALPLNRRAICLGILSWSAEL